MSFPKVPPDRNKGWVGKYCKDPGKDPDGLPNQNLRMTEVGDC